MLRLIKHFMADESAATKVEYAFIGSLVAVTIIISATGVGTRTKTTDAVSAINLR